MRREEALEAFVPEFITREQSEIDPEEEAELADSVGLALLVVLDRLSPAERLAFVLHDIIAIPFNEGDHHSFYDRLRIGISCVRQIERISEVLS